MAAAEEEKPEATHPQPDTAVGEGGSMTISARDLISKPYCRCPACGALALGVLMIQNNRCYRRCRQCLYPGRSLDKAALVLPSLRKSIVYVDQCAISNMMKALNPRTRDALDGRFQQRWCSLYERLSTATKMQLVCCPHSEYHFSESYVTPDQSLLVRMYELLSNGVEFKHSDWIKMAQVLDHVRERLTGTPPARATAGRASVFERDPDVWQGRLLVTIEPSRTDWLDHSLRTARGERHGQLENWFRDRQQDQGRSFDDFHRDEIIGFGEAVVWQYARYMDRRRRVVNGSEPPEPQDLLPGIPRAFAVELFEIVLRECLKHTGNETEAAESASNYFLSQAMSTVPFANISGLLFAGLARRAATGQRRLPK